MVPSLVMIVLSDEYHASYTVNIHRVIPSLRRQTLEKHHQLSPCQIDRVRTLGEFNLSEAILKADFCFQNNFTQRAQFRTPHAFPAKSEIARRRK